MLIASGPGVAALQDYTASTYEDGVDITLNQGDTLSTMKCVVHDPLSSFPIIMEDDLVALDETDPNGWPTCNLLLNPSLEAPYTSGVAQYWALTGGTTGVTAASSGTAAYGSASQQVTLANASNGVLTAFGQTVTLPTDSTARPIVKLPYYFSIWLYSSAVFVNTAVVLGIDWYNGATYLSTTSITLTSEFATGWTNWARQTVHSTPPANATAAHVYLSFTPTSGTNSGSVLIDGGQFEYATFANAPVSIDLPLVATSLSSSSDTSTSGFVRASSSGFLINGLPFHFVGLDSYDLVVGYGMTAAAQEARLAILASYGVKVVRTWAFGETNQTTQPTYSYFQWGATGQNYNEPVFELLDSAIVAAAKYGIRLILCCANNWGDYGGKGMYVTWYNTANSTSLVADNFHDTAALITRYKQYLNKLITRTNTLTGVAYANDPTIMAWECINEGRYGLGTDTNGNTLSSSHLATMTSWYSQISAYIKTLDSNHLVSCGGISQAYDYISGDPVHNGTGSYGLDFYTQCSLSTIDYGDFHLYPAHNYVSAGTDCTLTWPSSTAYDDQLSQYMGWMTAAGKPIMIGETGIDKRNSVVSPVVFDPRDQYFAGLYGYMFAGTCGGILLWNYNNTSNVDNTYGILAGVTYTDPTIAPGNTSDTALLNGIASRNATFPSTSGTASQTILAVNAQIYPTAYCDSTQLGCYVDNGGTGLPFRQLRLFAGFLKQADYDYTLGPEREITLSATQYSVLLSEAPANLILRNITDQAAIAQAITYAQNQGFLVGVNYTTYVASIITIDSLTFAWQTTRDVLNKVANMAVAAFWIDNYKYLHYQADLATTAAYGVSDNPDYLTTYPFAAWQFTDDSTQTRTTEVYEGGTILSLPVTMTFAGLSTTTTTALNSGTQYTSIAVTATTTSVVANSTLLIGGTETVTVAALAASGATTISVLAFTPGSTLASGATVVVNGAIVNSGNGVGQVDSMTVGGTAITVGYSGVSTGYGALIDLSTGIVTINAPLPGNGVTVAIVYRYPTPVIIRLRAPAATKLTTSSVKRNIHYHASDSTVTSIDSAIARANADMNQYQKARPIGQMNIYSPPWPSASHLVPGTAIPVTHSASGLNKQLFQIQQVDILLHAGVYMYTLKLGYYRPDFALLAFQSTRYLPQATTAPTSGDVLSEVLSAQDGWVVTDSITTKPPPSSTNVGTWGGPSTWGGSNVWG